MTTKNPRRPNSKAPAKASARAKAKAPAKAKTPAKRRPRRKAPELSRYGELSGPPPALPPSPDDCPVPVCADVHKFGSEALKALAQFRFPAGSNAGKPITANLLCGWQVRLIVAIFGHVDEITGTRLLRDIGIEIPRKQGKTTCVALIILLWMLSPRAMGAARVQILVTSETVNLSRVMFATLRDLITTNPGMLSRCRLRDHLSTIEYMNPDGVLIEVFVRVSSAAGHGISPALVVVDELHLLGRSNIEEGQRLIAGLRTAQGAISAPLRICLTTPPDAASSYKPGLPFMDWHERGQQLLQGEIEAPQELFIRFSAPENLPWDSEAAARAANPGLEIGLGSIDELLAEAKRAKESGSSLQVDAYRALRLGQIEHFKQSVTNWLPRAEIQRARTLLTPEDFEACDYLATGVDLGGREDWTSAALVGVRSDGHIYFLQQSWCTRAALARSGEKAGWQQFVDNGELIISDQDSVSFPLVLDQIMQWVQQTGVKQCGLDPAMAAVIAADLEGMLGLDGVHYVRQGSLSFTPLIEAIEQASSARQLILDDDDALEFAIANAVIEARGIARMITKDSRQPAYKIDPLISCCNGLALCLAQRLQQAKAPTAPMDWSLTV